MKCLSFTELNIQTHSAKEHMDYEGFLLFKLIKVYASVYLFITMLLFYLYIQNVIKIVFKANIYGVHDELIREARQYFN